MDMGLLALRLGVVIERSYHKRDNRSLGIVKSKLTSRQQGLAKWVRIAMGNVGKRTFAGQGARREKRDFEMQ